MLLFRSRIQSQLGSLAMVLVRQVTASLSDKVRPGSMPYTKLLLQHLGFLDPHFNQLHEPELILFPFITKKWIRSVEGCQPALFVKMYDTVDSG